MSDRHFRLSDAQFARLKSFLPNNARGVQRIDRLDATQAVTLAGNAGQLNLAFGRPARQASPHVG